MERMKTVTSKLKLFIDNSWTILVKVAEVVGGVTLFHCNNVQTMIGSLPIGMVLGAILIADVVAFVWQLLTAKKVDQ